MASALSSPELSRENSYASLNGEDNDKDGVTLPARGAAAKSGGPGQASGGAVGNLRRQDWLSPPSTPDPDTTPFFDESEAKRVHMVC